MTQELGCGRVYFHKDPLEFFVNGLRFSVPSYMMSDGYSAPRPFRGIFPKSMGGLLAAIAHDFLYSLEGSQLCSREDADDILRTLMFHYGHGWSSRRVVWSAVRTCGWKSYAKRNLQTHTHK